MTNEQLKNILFIDIETVPVRPRLEELPENLQELWRKKAKTLRAENAEDASPEGLFGERAGIFSEFSKVVCIGIGYLVQEETDWVLRLKSLAGVDEKILLNNFLSILDRFSSGNRVLKFSGHNIKEFDLPFLCRRMIINGMKLPASLELSNKKPWEIPHMDTLELWKFGDYKNYTSLALLAAVLGIPSPKNDLDGSRVAAVFWDEKDPERIARYCMQDVLTSARVLMHLCGRNEIEIKPVFT